MSDYMSKNETLLWNAASGVSALLLWLFHVCGRLYRIGASFILRIEEGNIIKFPQGWVNLSCRRRHANFSCFPLKLSVLHRNKLKIMYYMYNTIQPRQNIFAPVDGWCCRRLWNLRATSRTFKHNMIHMMTLSLSIAQKKINKTIQGLNGLFLIWPPTGKKHLTWRDVAITVSNKKTLSLENH